MSPEKTERLASLPSDVSTGRGQGLQGHVYGGLRSAASFFPEESELHWCISFAGTMDLLVLATNGSAVCRGTGVGFTRHFLLCVLFIA